MDTLGRDNVIAAVVNSELFSDREFSEAIDLGTEMGARVLGLKWKNSLIHISPQTHQTAGTIVRKCSTKPLKRMWRAKDLPCFQMG